MVPRENKNNAYAKFGGTNKEYYGIFQSGLLIQLYLENRVLYSSALLIYQGRMRRFISIWTSKDDRQILSFAGQHPSCFKASIYPLDSDLSRRWIALSTF